MGCRDAYDAGVVGGGANRDAGDAGGRGDNVYRPSLDFFTAFSHTSTPSETQFTGVEIFSLGELRIDLEEADTLVPGGVGRGQGESKKKRKGKRVVGESSQPADGGSPARRNWTDDENVALSKAWLSVCDDPLVANN